MREYHKQQSKGSCWISTKAQFLAIYWYQSWKVNEFVTWNGWLSLQMQAQSSRFKEYVWWCPKTQFHAIYSSRLYSVHILFNFAFIDLLIDATSQIKSWKILMMANKSLIPHNPCTSTFLRNWIRNIKFLIFSSSEITGEDLKNLGGDLQKLNFLQGIHLSFPS